MFYNGLGNSPPVSPASSFSAALSATGQDPDLSPLFNQSLLQAQRPLFAPQMVWRKRGGCFGRGGFFPRFPQFYSWPPFIVFVGNPALLKALQDQLAKVQGQLEQPQPGQPTHPDLAQASPEEVQPQPESDPAAANQSETQAPAAGDQSQAAPDPETQEQAQMPALQIEAETDAAAQSFAALGALYQPQLRWPEGIYSHSK